MAVACHHGHYVHAEPRWKIGGGGVHVPLAVYTPGEQPLMPNLPCVLPSFGYRRKESILVSCTAGTAHDYEMSLTPNHIHAVMGKGHSYGISPRHYFHKK